MNSILEQLKNVLGSLAPRWDNYCWCVKSLRVHPSSSERALKSNSSRQGRVTNGIVQPSNQPTAGCNSPNPGLVNLMRRNEEWEKNILCHLTLKASTRENKAQTQGYKQDLFTARHNLMAVLWQVKLTLERDSGLLEMQCNLHQSL